MQISYSLVFELIALFLTSSCANVFGNLNQPQSELLDKLKPCIIRIVFLENSIPASENVLSFLDYYQNQGTFILDSIPASSKDYITDSKQATTRHRDVRFMPCSAIFYFQNEFFDAANKKKELPTMAIHHFFRTFVVFQRNENPASIIFITFNSSPVSSTLYIAVTPLHTTSSFYILSPINTMLICATCGTRILYETNTFSDSNWRKVHQHFSDPIPVSNLVNRPWDTNRISSFYTCGIPPKRLISGGYPRAQTVCTESFSKYLIQLTVF